MDRVKRIWYLSPMRAAKVQASLRIRAVSPEPSLLAHTSSESRGTFRQKTRSLAPLNGWTCAVKICHDGMLEDTNSLDGAQIMLGLISFFFFKLTASSLVDYPFPQTCQSGLQVSFQRTKLYIFLFSATFITGGLHFFGGKLPELCRTFLQALASLTASFLVIRAEKFMCTYKKGLTSPEMIETYN